MKLQVFETDNTTRLSLQDVLNYSAFSNQQRTTAHRNELQTFEKYTAALTLVSSGLTTFLDPEIVPDGNRKNSLKVDIAAVNPENGNITVVFCQTSSTDPSLWSALKIVTNSENGNAQVFAPATIDESTIRKNVPGAIETGKVSLETVGWFEDTFERSMVETLRMLELLANETRIRMLAPLFRKPTANKKEYRAKINPKLVYSNIDALSEAGFLNEAAQGAYELSNFGKAMLGEFLTFLEKTRRILDEAKQQ